MIRTITTITLLIFALATSYANAAQFSTYEVEGNNVVQVFGEIVAGDELRLHQEITNSNANLVLLQSPGGSVDVGWKMAAVIRANQVDTFVVDQCASACTYAFMGGVQRTITDTAKMGYHSFRIDTDTSLNTNDLLQYGQAEGVRAAKEYISYAGEKYALEILHFIDKVYHNTHWSSMYWANPYEMTVIGFATNVVKG